MGGTISAGRSNAELVHNLATQHASSRKCPQVEELMLGVDRGNYFLPGFVHFAYQDQAWKHNQIHLSAPVIYWEVLDLLQLRPGLSFLNLGSGTGYLSTMVALILGPNGVNHGIELHQEVIDFANEKLAQFKQGSESMDRYDFCEPVFVQGNCLNLPEEGRQYDRVYCGAACPEDKVEYMKNLIKVDGILVMPYGDFLVQIRRVAPDQFKTLSRMQVAFSSLQAPHATDTPTHAQLPELNPRDLKDLARISIRQQLRSYVEETYPYSTQLKKFVPRPKQRRPHLSVLARDLLECCEEEELDSDLSGDEHMGGRVMLSGSESDRHSVDTALETTGEEHTPHLGHQRMENAQDENMENVEDPSSPSGGDQSVEKSESQSVRTLEDRTPQESRNLPGSVADSLDDVETPKLATSNEQATTGRERPSQTRSGSRGTGRHYEDMSLNNQGSSQNNQRINVHKEESSGNNQGISGCTQGSSRNIQGISVHNQETSGHNQESPRQNQKKALSNRTDEEKELKEKLESVLRVEEERNGTNSTGACRNDLRMLGPTNHDIKYVLTRLKKTADTLNSAFGNLSNFQMNSRETSRNDARESNREADEARINCDSDSIRQGSNHRELDRETCKAACQLLDREPNVDRRSGAESDDFDNLAMNPHMNVRNMSQYVAQENETLLESVAAKESSQRGGLQDESPSSFKGTNDTPCHVEEANAVESLSSEGDECTHTSSATDTEQLGVGSCQSNEKQVAFKREKFDSGVVDDESAGNSSSNSVDSGGSNDSALESHATAFPERSRDRLNAILRLRDLDVPGDTSLGCFFGDGVRTFGVGTITDGVFSNVGNRRYSSGATNKNTATNANENEKSATNLGKSHLNDSLWHRPHDSSKVSGDSEMYELPCSSRTHDSLNQTSSGPTSGSSEPLGLSSTSPYPNYRELQAMKQKLACNQRHQDDGNKRPQTKQNFDSETIKSEAIRKYDERNSPTSSDDKCETNIPDTAGGDPEVCMKKSPNDFQSSFGEERTLATMSESKSRLNEVNQSRSRLSESSDPSCESKRKYAMDSEAGEDVATHDAASPGYGQCDNKRNKKFKPVDQRPNDLDQSLNDMNQSPSDMDQRPIDMDQSPCDMDQRPNESGLRPRSVDQRREDFIVRARDSMLVFSDHVSRLINETEIQVRNDSDSRLRREAESRLRNDSDIRRRNASNNRLRNDSDSRLRNDPDSRLRNDSESRLNASSDSESGRSDERLNDSWIRNIMGSRTRMVSSDADSEVDSEEEDMEDDADVEDILSYARLMREAIQSLPLPHSVKRYLNYDRDL